jgi:TrmH family RNA methyltransferase
MKKIESNANQTIKDLVKLQDKKNILETGLFLIEGKNIVTETIDKGLVKELFVTEENFDENLDIHQTIVSESVIHKLSSNNTNPGVIGVAFYQPLKTDISSLNKVIVLENINNPGNLGAIIRSAKAFGYECIITLGNSVFPYNDKVIKASQGAIMNMPVLNITKLELLARFSPVFFELSEKSKNMDNVKVNEPYALVFGNEANGVSEELKSI